MPEKQENAKKDWESPEISALTDTGIRADGADVPVRNGALSGDPV